MMSVKNGYRCPATNAFLAKEGLLLPRNEFFKMPFKFMEWDFQDIQPFYLRHFVIFPDIYEQEVIVIFNICKGNFWDRLKISCF